jgi:hypothetical protein
MAGKEERVRLIDAQGKFSPGEVAELIREEGVDPTREYKIEELKKKLTGINELASLDASGWEITDTDDVLLVAIHDKKRNVIYHTIARGGRALFTHDDTGMIDYSRVYESIDEVIEVCVTQGVPEQIIKNRRGGDGGGDGGTRTPPSKPQLAFDPVFMQYLHDNKESITYDANKCSDREARPHMIKSKPELEKILGPKMVKKAGRSNCNVGAMTMKDFISKHRKAINKARVIYRSELLKNPRITRLMGAFSSFVKRKKSGSSQFSKYCSNQENALEVYAWLKRNTPEDVPLTDMAQALRDYIENGFKDAPEDQFARIRKATSWWVAATTAGNYLEKNPCMQEKVMPYLQSEDEDMSICDKNFEAIREIGKMFTDPTHQYDKIRQFRFVIEGLQLFGLIEHDKFKGPKRKWKPESVGAAYIQPMSHLMQRYAIYHTELSEAFEKLRDKGKLKDLKIETANDCTKFGKELYYSIPKSRRRKIFSRLKVRSVPLGEDSTHFEGILRMYVGVNKEYFLENAGQPKT